MPASPEPPVPDWSLELGLEADPEAVPPDPVDPGLDVAPPLGPRLVGSDVEPPRSLLP